MIPNIPEIFITVDCRFVAFFSNWVKIAPPWPCRPWQLRF
jgi:hypothetical protein